MSWAFERVAGPFEGATGGVVWTGTSVLFAAVNQSLVLSYDPVSGTVDVVRRFANRINGLTLDAKGRLYGCQEGSRRIVELRPDGSAVPLAATLDGRRINYPTDLTIGSDGRIWFADPYNPLPSHGPQLFEPLPHASVLRLERHPTTHEWRVRRATHDTAAPRAVLLSADERTLYVADGDVDREAPRELRAYPIEADRLGSPVVLHSFGADHRGPHRGVEGMCLDADGNIVACAGARTAGPGPLIYVFSPQGRVLETHPLPNDSPMRCAFGGPEIATLYVTSAGGSLWRSRGAHRTGRPRPVHA